MERTVEVRTDDKTVEFEDTVEVAEDESPVVEVPEMLMVLEALEVLEDEVVNPGQPGLLVLSCTVTKSPVPLCSITTCSQLNVDIIETFTAGPSAKLAWRNL